MTNTNIYLCNNGECRAKEFIEDNYRKINNDGTVHYVEFIEGYPSIKLDKSAFYVFELLERSVVYLTNESDELLIDEFNNYLTTIV